MESAEWFKLFGGGPINSPLRVPTNRSKGIRTPSAVTRLRDNTNT